MNVYVDNAATTRMSDTAVKAMLPCLQDYYGNPSSLHGVGQKANELMSEARQTIADCLGCSPREITFTGGVNAASQEFKPEGTRDRCPLCGIALDENGEIIGYQYVKMGPMMEDIKKGVDANDAVKKYTGPYGRFDGAAKYIDPRHE